MFMIPSTNYLAKFLHEAALLETIEQYIRRGYQVSKNVNFGKSEVDLLVTNDKEKIYFEFKVGNGFNNKAKQQLTQLKKLAQQEGAEFRIVYVKPPLNKGIEVDDIESALFDFWIKDTPSEITELSTHSTVIDVSSVDISNIRVKPNEIEVSGSCSILVGLQFGSGSDLENGDGLIDKESFLTSFALKLDNNLQVIEVDYIKVDTSHWYGE